MQNWRFLELLNAFGNPIGHCFLEMIQINDEIIQVWNIGDVEKRAESFALRDAIEQFVGCR